MGLAAGLFPGISQDESYLPLDDVFHRKKADEFTSAKPKYLVEDAVPGAIRAVLSAVPDLAQDACDAKQHVAEFPSYAVYGQLFADPDDSGDLARSRESHVFLFMLPLLHSECVAFSLSCILLACRQITHTALQVFARGFLQIHPRPSTRTSP